MESQRESREKQAARRAKVALFGGAVAISSVFIGKGVEAGNVDCSGQDREVVEAGETLWEYADEINDGSESNRVIVQEIEAMNPGMEAGHLLPGQSITLPKECE